MLVEKIASRIGSSHFLSVLGLQPTRLQNLVTRCIPDYAVSSRIRILLGVDAGSVQCSVSGFLAQKKGGWIGATDERD